MIPSRIWWLSAVAAAVVSFAVLSPAAAQAPPAAVPPAATSDNPFGEEVTLAEKTIVYIAGSGMWDSAFNTIIGGFKTVNSAMAKLGLKANGAPMTIYTATDDTGFQFQAAVPVAQASTVPANSGITVGKSPAGKALKFVHRGSYDAMDSTYELITNYLDEKQLEPKDVFVEQYMKDPVTTPEDDLVIEVYVPLK
jgi:effector-binding domain-containing protein